MLTWVALAALVLFSAGTFVLGRRRLAAGVSAHSRPGYHGAYVMLWTAIPAALVLFLHLGFSGRIEAALLRADAPAAVQAMSNQDRNVFYDDARAMAHGQQRSETVYAPPLDQALEAKAIEAERLQLA